MLPLGTWLLILGDHLPAIGVVGIDKHLPCSHINHRLDGEHHAWYQQHARTLMTIMVHIGLLMELQTYPMPGKVSHHAVVILLAVLLDGVTDIAHKRIGLCHLHTYLQALLSHTHQLLFLRRGLADDEHTTGVRIITIKNCREIHIDDITLLQHILLFGDAVTYHLVDRGAYRHREPLIVQTGRYGSVILTVLTTNPINLQGTHPGVNLLCHLIEHTSVHHTRLADALYLLWGLYQIARRHQPPFVLPIHDGLVHLRRFLSRQAVPSSFSLKCVHLPYLYINSGFTRNPLQSYNLVSKYPNIFSIFIPAVQGTCRQSAS